MSVGWLVICFAFKGPLRQDFSLYQNVSQREGERREMIDLRKLSKQPVPASAARAVGPCPTVIQISRTPALEVYPAPSQHPITPIHSVRLKHYAWYDVNPLNSIGNTWKNHWTMNKGQGHARLHCSCCT